MFWPKKKRTRTKSHPQREKGVYIVPHEQALNQAWEKPLGSVYVSFFGTEINTKTSF